MDFYQSFANQCTPVHGLSPTMIPEMSHGKQTQAKYIHFKMLSAMYTRRTTLSVCSFCPPPACSLRKSRNLPHNQISLRNLFWLRWWHSSCKYYCPEGRCSHRMVMPGREPIFPTQHWVLWCEFPTDRRCLTLVLHMRWLNSCSPWCLQERLQDKTKDRSQKCTKSSFL